MRSNESCENKAQVKPYNSNDNEPSIKPMKHKIPDGKFDALVISDYNKGFFDKYFIRQVSLIFKKENKLIITNPKRKNVSFYNYSNILVPNEKEFKNFFTKKNTLVKMIDLVFYKAKSLKYFCSPAAHMILDTSLTALTIRTKLHGQVSIIFLACAACVCG